MAELSCAELVEQITDYLEGVLPLEQIERFRSHLSGCDGCEAYLEQMRTTLRILRGVDGEQISDESRLAIEGIFHQWTASRAGET